MLNREDRERVRRAVEQAIEAARKRDVTLQLLCMHGGDESTRGTRDVPGIGSVRAATKESAPAEPEGE
jgi:hypothetical protein